MLSQAEVRDRCERIEKECEEQILQNLNQFLFEPINSKLKIYVGEVMDSSIMNYVDKNIHNIISMAPPSEIKKALVNLKLERWERLFDQAKGTISYGDRHEKCFFDESTCQLTINSAYVVEAILKNFSDYV